MVHSLGSYANPVEIFFKISPDHLNIDMSWHVRMIETIKQPLETLLMTPWKWPIWVILHCKNCTSENFRTEGGHHFFFTFFGFPSLILTIRSYPKNFIASRTCKVTPSINTVAAWVNMQPFTVHCCCPGPGHATPSPCTARAPAAWGWSGSPTSGCGRAASGGGGRVSRCLAQPATLPAWYALVVKSEPLLVLLCYVM